jgi:hypothetical protein
MPTLLLIEGILNTPKSNLIVVASVVEGEVNYTSGENLRLDGIEVERTMPPRTITPRFDLLAFSMKKNDKITHFTVGQLVTMTQ